MSSSTALTASLSATSGSADTRRMRSWFLRWISVGPDWLRKREQVLGLHHLSARSIDQHVVDVFDTLTILFAQPHDDRIFVAVLTEERGLCAGDVRADAVGHVGHRQTEQCGLRAVDVDRQLGTAFFAADPRVAHGLGPCPSGSSRPSRCRAPSAGRPREFRARGGCLRRPSSGSSAGCRLTPGC